jgi:hypothetical protein
MNNYILITTAVEDVKAGSPAGAINGGMFPVKDDWPDQYPSIVIGVGDISVSIKMIDENGGEVLGEPHEIPGFGLYVSFRDTEGNRLSMIQPISKLEDRNVTSSD